MKLTQKITIGGSAFILASSVGLLTVNALSGDHSTTSTQDASETVKGVSSVVVETKTTPESPSIKPSDSTPTASVKVTDATGEVTNLPATTSGVVRTPDAKTSWSVSSDENSSNQNSVRSTVVVEKSTTTNSTDTGGSTKIEVSNRTDRSSRTNIHIKAKTGGNELNTENDDDVATSGGLKVDFNVTNKN